MQGNAEIVGRKAVFDWRFSKPPALLKELNRGLKISLVQRGDALIMGLLPRADRGKSGAGA
jgi:hypothetical protein